MSLLRFRLPACLALAAATAAFTVAQTVIAPLASAAPEPGPEEDRGCSGSGDVLRYVVIFDEGTKAKRAKREIKQACGTLSTYYDAIAVAVATSRDREFGERIGVDRAFSAQAHRSSDGREAEHVQATRPATLDDTDRTDEQWDMRMINAAAARKAAPKDADDVVVGVLDSGIDAAHPELEDAVDPGVSAGCLSGKPNPARRAWTPTTSVHGTHVAGTIAAADDGAGVVGVAPGVRLASIKVIGDEGQVDPEAAVCGLMWAGKHRMAVSNSSYFVDAGDTSCRSEDEYGVVREAMSRAADYATRAGVLNVAAATNESVSLSAAEPEAEGCEALPASLRSVVAVSSVDAEGVKSGYSSYGLGVISLAAPGGDDGECVLSTVPGGYSDTCGTSMAAPHVSGVAALLAAKDPHAGPEMLRQSLTTTAEQTACPADYDRAGDGHQDAFCTGYRGYNGFYGHGVLDALAAVESIAGRPEPKAPAKRKTRSPRVEKESADSAPHVLTKPNKPDPDPRLALRLNLVPLLGAR